MGNNSISMENIQSILRSALFISTARWIVGSNCSIEIVLSDKEISELIEIGENAFAFHSALPISRIKNIYFKSRDQLKTTIWNTNNGAAFIPEEMAIVDDNSIVKDLRINPPRYSFDKNLFEKAKRFDIILGGFSLMKISTEKGGNYPKNFFYTLSYFNSLIKEDIETAIRKDNIKFSENYLGLFKNQHNDKWAKYRHYLINDIPFNELVLLANSENIKLTKNSIGTINLESVKGDSIIYDILLLSVFGLNKSKGIEDLILYMNSKELPQSKIEEIGLLLGMRTGYSKLRNLYKVGNEQYEIKLTLESKIDYYIVESLYQFIFNGNKDCREFPYLNQLLPKPQIGKISKNFNSYRILGEQISGEKTENISEYIYNNNDIEILFKQILTDNYSIIPNYFKPDFNAGLEHYKRRYTPILNNIINTRLSQALKAKNEEENNRYLNLPNEAKNPLKSIEERGLEMLPFAELKKIAKNSGIKDLSKYKGSVNDMREIIGLILKTIL